MYLASGLDRFDARHLLTAAVANNVELDNSERERLQVLAYPWQTRDGPAFVQSPGGIWVPDQ